MTRMVALPERLDDVVHLTAGEDMQPIFEAIVAASPGQGAVTAEQLEAAVASLSALWKRGEPFPTAERQAATVIAALGLTVQP